MQKFIELRNLVKNKNDPEFNKYMEILDKLIEDPEFMKLVELLKSDSWPAAVDPALICDIASDSDKLNRAEGILELLIDESIENKKFLDFGCGEGHVPFHAASKKPIISVGYDIKDDSHWENLKNDKVILTSNIEIVKSNAPYDIILIYDVLDHMESSNMVKVLTQTKDLLSNDGTIYLRFHPFCSRHATHLYHKINKAFMHLIFTTDELHKLGYETPIAANVVFPLHTYSTLIENSHLKVINFNTIREKVDDFFHNDPIIKKRIKTTIHDPKNDFPDWQCQQQFLDYVLKK